MSTFNVSINYCNKCGGCVDYKTSRNSPPIMRQRLNMNTKTFGICLCPRCSICSKPAPEGLIDGDFCLECWVDK